MMYRSTTQATVQIKEGLAGRLLRRPAQQRPTRVVNGAMSLPSTREAARRTAARRAAVVQPALIMKLVVR